MTIAKSLWCKGAPGETRTPNLLIRSQSPGRGLLGSAQFERFMPAKEAPKPDSLSHNISHNSVPDPYSDSKIFVAWGWAA